MEKTQQKQVPISILELFLSGMPRERIIGKEREYPQVPSRRVTLRHKAPVGKVLTVVFTSALLWSQKALYKSNPILLLKHS